MLWWLIAVIVFLIVFFIVFKTIRKLISIIFSVLVVLLIVFAVLGFFTAKDAKELGDSLANEQNTFLLENNGKITAGFEGIITGGVESTTFFDVEEIITYNEYYEKENYAQMKGQSSTIFIISKEAFEGVDDFLGETHAPEFIEELLVSENPGQRYIESKEDFTIEDLYEQFGISSEEEFRGVVFYSLFLYKESDDSLFIFKEFKKGSCTVYPETIAFKFMDKIPNSMLKKVQEKIKQGVQNAAEKAKQEIKETITEKVNEGLE